MYQGERHEMRIGILASDLGMSSLKENIKIARKIGSDSVEFSVCKGDERPNVASCTRSDCQWEKNHLKCKTGEKVDYKVCVFNQR